MGGKLTEFAKKRKWRIKIKTWMLFLVLAILLPISATLLRNDHVKMAELRFAVLTADEEEKFDELAERLDELKRFVVSNIVVNVVEENGTQRVTFGTGPFYLEHLYLRDARRALEDAEKQFAGDGNKYGNIYGLAGEVCRERALENGWEWSSPEFINCMLDEIGKYPESEDIQDTIKAKLPSTELYRMNFASYVWAPTLSGWCILVCLIIIVVIFIRLVIWIVLRLSLLFM